MEIEIIKHSFQKYRRGINFNLQKNIDDELIFNKKIHPRLKKIFKSYKLGRLKLGETHEEKILMIFHRTLMSVNYFNFIFKLIINNCHNVVGWGIRKINFTPNRTFINQIILAADEKMINILNDAKFFRPYHPSELLRSFPHLILSGNFHKCIFKESKLPILN